MRSDLKIKYPCARQASHLRNAVVIVIMAFTLTGGVFCQETSENVTRGILTITRLPDRIDFDGVPDDEAWSSVATIGLTMYSPVFGQQPSETSDIRMAYDDQNMYVGARLFYDDPSMIRTASLKRDYMGQGGDFFALILDTYNDKENGLMFVTTPDALRTEGTIQRDALVNNSNRTPYNLSWNTFWDVKTTRDDRGWSLEMRIPLSSLRFQVTDGVVRQGVIIQRWIPAKNEMNIFPAIPPNWGQYSVIKPSQANEAIINDIKPQSPLYLTPYLLAGFARSFSKNSEGTSFFSSDNPTLEAGLDVKYGLSPTLVMDMTVNTDFAQVEADDQQVNLTRFSLYFPEKRLFFLERSNVFDFSLGGNNNIFYSRRIGLSNEGVPVRIYGGLRLTGRLGKWDIGLMDMQTAPFEMGSENDSDFDYLPSENFAALRLRRQVINSNSFIGSMMTSRLGMNGSHNIVYGVDGLFRVFGEDYLDIKLVRSSDSDIKPASFVTPARVYTLWERRAKIGLGYAMGFSYVGTDYDPAMGFERLNNYGLYRLDLRYGWLSGPKSALFRHSPELELRHFFYADDGSLMTNEIKGTWVFEAKSKWMGEVFAELTAENLKDTLSLGGGRVYIPPAKYNNKIIGLDISTPDSKPLFFKTEIESGAYFDGFRFSVKIQPTWNISRHFELGGSYSFDYVDFSGRDQLMKNHIVGVKTLIMADTKLSFNGYVQYNTGENLIAANLRLRYNPREGNDFYLVFNEGRNTDLTREVPRLPRYNLRSVMLKYSYTFTVAR